MNDMEDKEKLKALVLARAGKTWKDAYQTDYEIIFGEFHLHPQSNRWWSLSKYWGVQNTVAYRFGVDLPASDPVWALVAPILGIQIEK